jgi:hypothetical protein
MKTFGRTLERSRGPRLVARFRGASPFRARITGEPPEQNHATIRTASLDAPPLPQDRFATAAFTAASWRRVLGANDRVGIGVIGVGLMGRVHTRNFQAQPDAQVVAVAETYRPRLDAAAALVGGKPAQYGDFRKLLENKSVDAVVVNTPDHWHALMTMMACAAGKDVYVEKPLTLFVREGRWMVEVARRHKRIVQVGTQQRSGGHYQQARKLVQDGRLGQLVSVQCGYFRNVSPGFGNPPDQDPPADLDYDMWLGPAPKRPYNPNRAIYHFRWFWDYSVDR